MVLYDDMFVCSAEGDCYFDGINGNRTTWLVIETACFYMYVLATVFYIIWRQCVGIFDGDTLAKSDMTKALQDFITYAAINLTWFAINFVLVMMPPILLYCIDGPTLQLPGSTGSYIPIIYCLWGMHFCHFIFQLRIYDITDESMKKHSGTGAAVDTAFDQDDAFKLQENDLPQDKSTDGGSETLKKIGGL